MSSSWEFIPLVLSYQWVVFFWFPLFCCGGVGFLHPLLICWSEMIYSLCFLEHARAGFVDRHCLNMFSYGLFFLLYLLQLKVLLGKEVWTGIFVQALLGFRVTTEKSKVILTCLLLYVTSSISWTLKCSKFQEAFLKNIYLFVCLLV